MVGTRFRLRLQTKGRIAGVPARGTGCLIFGRRAVDLGAFERTRDGATLGGKLSTGASLNHAEKCGLLQVMDMDARH